jgi:iron(III) transport system ATP-binding protein
MRSGEIVQIDTPEALYNEPADAWVASFLNAGSLVDGNLHNGAFKALGSEQALRLNANQLVPNGRATMVLPGAALKIDADGVFELIVSSVHFKGDRYEIVTRWGGAHGPVIRFWHDRSLNRGDAVRVGVDHSKIRVFPFTGAVASAQ